MEHRPVDRMALISGLVFIALGFAFLLDRLGIVEVPPSIVIPVVLVALGIGMLLGRGEVRVERDAEVPPDVTHETQRAPEPPRSDDTDP